MVVLGIALAVVSAAVSQLGNLWRQRGAHDAPEVDVRHPLRSIKGLFTSKWWAIGYAMAAVAYGFHVAALGIAPLSVVQAVLAGGFVLLGLIASRAFGMRLGRREWTGLLLCAVGLAAVTLTGGSSDSGHATYSLAVILPFEVGVLVLGVLALIGHGRGHLAGQKGVLLGGAAGLLFSASHIAMKATSGDVRIAHPATLLDPWIALVVVCGAVAFFASARSLQVAEGVTVIAVTTLTSNVVTIPAGIVVFGDPLGSGPMIVLRVLAFALVIGAATLIPVPHRGAEDGVARRAPSPGGGRAAAAPA